MSSHYLKPTRLENHQGKERRVGVEIELIGPKINELVDTIVEFFPGDVTATSPYEWEINTRAFGEFRVEVDFSLLKQIGKQAQDTGDLLDELAGKALNSVSSVVVPLEIVTPPIPFTSLPSLDPVVKRLHEIGAQGSFESIFYAFGVHLNPEVPDMQAGTLLSYLQAYMCLHDWIVEQEQTDLSRRLSPYIKPFEKNYEQHILVAGYQPDLDMLMSDYLRFNPSRNRALDMLPLFTHLDEKKVRKVVKSELVKPRPTFHYRLPDCDIDNPDWGIWKSWNEWVAVEELASDPARLRSVCDAYLKHTQSLIPDILDPWHKKVTAWLQNPSL